MTVSPPTLYLIDGYAQFFRAYHAIRTPMSSPVTKEPTNMTFGFVGMLLKLLRGEGRVGGRPEYVAVTLDVSGDRGTFRSTIYEEYKANRPPPPEDLEPQVDRALAMLKAIGVPIIGAEGFEADDVIATLVTTLRAAHPDLRIRIISKDKDLKQLLINDHVSLFDIHKDEEITAESFKAETGIEPSQVIDMLALMGDNVDNVPGVEGVGPKTAAELIAKYGTLENLLAKADEIKGKRGEALRAAGQGGLLKLSKQLVSLRHDVPVELPLESARARGFRLGELIPILRELGFNRYQEEVKALLGPGAAAAEPVENREMVTDAGVRVAVPAPKRTATGQGAAVSGGDGLFDQRPDDSSTPSPAPLKMPQSGVYRAITTKAQLKELVAELKGAECIAIDTETTGLEPLKDELCGVCLSTQIGTGVYIPIRSPEPKSHLDHATVIAALKPVLEDPAKPKCGHNLKFDALVLRKAGITLGGFFAEFGWPIARGADVFPPESCVGATLPTATVFDSMVASYLIDATRSSHGLDSLALALLGRTNISIKDLIGTGPTQRRFDEVPLEQATQYAAEDADVALQLRAIMLPQLHAMGLLPLFRRVEMPLVEVLAELEWNGIRVDRTELEHQRARLQVRIDELRKQIIAYTEDHLKRPFNPDSPRQLAEVLFNKSSDEPPGFGLKSLKKTKTGHSTDVEVLEKIAQDPDIDNPIPEWIVEHRQLSKLVGTYLESLAQEIYPEGVTGVLGGGRIHSSFNQTVASTGRLSSSDPNLQNIPIRTEIGREIRKAFVAEREHVLVSADYSQIELRLLAHLARDAALIEAFRSDQDIHTAVAAQIHGVAPDKVTKEQRSGAKMVNFGIVYGVTPFGLARRLKVEQSVAAEIIAGYKKKFAGITTFLQECVEQARRHGYVETMLKRRRPILDIESNIPARRALAERLAINSVVQGSAADLIKLAMVDLHGRIRNAGLDRGPTGRRRAEKAATTGPGAPESMRMLLQIHDELVFECRREEAEAARALMVDRMQSAMALSVPLRVDARFAPNWFEGK